MIVRGRERLDQADQLALDIAIAFNVSFSGRQRAVTRQLLYIAQTTAGFR